MKLCVVEWHFENNRDSDLYSRMAHLRMRAIHRCRNAIRPVFVARNHLKKEVVVTSVADARQTTTTRFVCRSYLAVVLAPEPPIVEWIAEIDQRLKSAESFLSGAPVVVDLSAVKLSKLAIVHLISELEQRGIHVLGLENVDPLSTGAGLPPLVRSSHAGRVIPDKAESPAQDVRKEHQRYWSTSRYGRANRYSFPMGT